MEVPHEDDIIPLEPHPSPTYLALRHLALRFCPPEKPQGVKTLLFEGKTDGQIYTLAFQCDGSVSLYLSHGGGVIGAGKTPEVKEASTKILQLSNKLLPTLEEKNLWTEPPPEGTWELPQNERAQVLLLTPFRSYLEKVEAGKEPQLKEISLMIEQCHQTLLALQKIEQKG